MSYEEAKILRQRAEAFLTNSARLMQEGEWDLAVFNMEQFCQLILKYKLLVKTGTYPRTHSLRMLVRELAKHDPGIEFLVKDERNLHFVGRLEEAYVTARYMPYRYEEAEVSSLYRFVVDVFKPAVEAV